MSAPAPLTVAVAQIATGVGEIAANTRRIIDAIHIARDREGAGLVVFPEMAVTGYPPDDLLLRRDFLRATETALAEVARACTGITAVVGAPLERDGGVRNAAVVLTDGGEQAVSYKRLLPSYSVFDDNRHFTAGSAPCVFPCGGRWLAAIICEDLWASGPIADAAAAGAEAVIAINASPFHAGKPAEREAVAARRVAEAGLPVVYANAVGGQDEVVYDGASFAVDAAGRVAARAPFMEEAVTVFHLDKDGAVTGPRPPLPDEIPSVYSALVRATGDYVRRNGFEEVVLGLSGGLDSALVAAVAVDALGAGRVQAVMMPTRYTASRSLEDARAVVDLLEVDYRIVEIEPLFTGYLEALAPLFADRPADATEENIQSRIRGNLLMALSNKFGRMLLATGNKSELAVGYATLYGDMSGGFAPLKDVYKTDAYRLAEYRNRISPAVPEAVIERPPTAELRHDQRDEDSLPPYPVLDGVLALYMEEDLSVGEIVSRGFDPAVVERVVGMLYRNEYKRRQAAPGVKVTRRAFGRDRRYPITSSWRGISET